MGSFTLDYANNALCVGLTPPLQIIPLTIKEFQILAYPIQNPDRIVPGSKMRHQLWDLNEEPISNVVAAQMRLLRRKLATYNCHCPIETILIANAIQYTPAGGDVSVSLTLADRTASIAIKDTGIGIAPSHQTRIFERFYRVDSDRARKTGGTGLGLAIVQAIVQRHQGQITVKSELGSGSLFTICLPVGT